MDWRHTGGLGPDWRNTEGLGSDWNLDGAWTEGRSLFLGLDLWLNLGLDSNLGETQPWA